MKYIASISDNYPYKYYGEFISQNDCDYLMFIEGKKIHNIIDYKIVYNISKSDNLYKWDILATNRTIYLINERVKELIKALGVNNVEYLPANAFTITGSIIDGYYILNILDGKDIYRNDETQIIYSEHFVREFKKRKLKGLTFYPLDIKE